MKAKIVLPIVISILLFSLVSGTRFMEKGAEVTSAVNSGQGFPSGLGESVSVDWWPMFHHDLNHTGYSTSKASSLAHNIWNYTTGDWVWSSSPAVASGRVYVGSRDNKTYCLDATTGEYIWNFTTGWFVESSPAVADGKVYVGSYDGKIYCLIDTTGVQIWNYTTGDIVVSSPAVVESRVYVGSLDNKTYCLNATTGEHIWNYTTGDWVSSSPAVVEGRVYVGSGDQKVYCLNASTGAEIWNYTAGNWVSSSPAVVDGRVYVGSADHKIYCLNASTGVHVWNYTTGDYVVSSPAVANGRVYVGSWDDKVYCLNATSGAHIWNYTTGSVIYSSPAVADGKVYVGSNDRRVYCLNALTGTEIWSYTTGGRVVSSPAVADGKVFVGSEDTKVYAFGPPYDVTIKASYNICADVSVAVAIDMDGLPTGFTTPHTFTGLVYTHTFKVASTDPCGHPFERWSTGETSTTITVTPITVTAGGTYTAIYSLATLFWDFPRLDTLYMVEAWPWQTALTMAKECKIDVYLGSVQASAIDDLSALGWSVTHSGGGLHYCYFGANCRDYVPVGVMPYDYMGRTPGFSLYPVNVSSFRHALPYIVGCEKTSWLWDILKYIVVRNDFPMPPGFGEWRNPYISEYPEDWALAEDILIENGFTWSLGLDGLKHTTDDIWYMPNGQVLIGGRTSTHPGSERVAGTGGQTGIYAISPGTAPTSVEVVRRHVKKWNSFFTGESVEGIGDPLVLFHHDIIMSLDNIIQIVWQDRAHDLFYLCGSFSARNPDYLYDTFETTQDVWDGNDDSGISNAGLDHLLYSIKFFMMKDYELLAYNTGEDPEKVVDLGTAYTVAQPSDILDVKIERCDKTGVYYEILTPGVDYTLVGNVLTLSKDISLYPGDALEIGYNDMTYDRVITDIDFFRDIVWLADWKIFYLNPQIGVYSRDYFDLFKPGHEGWVNAPGYGAGAYNLPWTFASIHETCIPTCGVMKWQIEGAVTTLNPVKAKWVYEAEILNRIYEGLITRNPYYGTEMPWIAKKITETAVDLGGQPGEVMRFELRDDVTWQDGSAVNASSIKWNFDYIAHTCADIAAPMPEFVTIWSFYVKTEIVSTYVADVYVNVTGHWKVLDYAGVALQFPQIIWESKQTYADITGFKPWAVAYATLVGHAPPNGLAGLSCLMGTGPYFLNIDLGGWNEAGLAVMSKYPGYWKRHANPGDINLNMKVDEDDLWYFCAQFIDYYKLGCAHVFCDYDRNMKIDEDDLWYFCDLFICYYKYGLHYFPR